ncbi:MAG: hypothetical protein IKH88_18295 [Prevotella sp.]|nr:hypothetical protein [Prevotella sp.]
MTLQFIPGDLDVEELLDFLPEKTCSVMFKGLHARNAFGDIVDMDVSPEGRMQLSLARNSIYHYLPEYLFHRIDRFDNLPKLEEKERFKEELEKQEKERENARKFFEPVDLMLLQMRMKVRRKMREWTDSNKVLIDILADRLTEEQKENPLIKSAVAFLPKCRDIRGNHMLLTLMMRKIFLEEGLNMEESRRPVTFEDTEPTHYDFTVGSTLGECFAGNVFEENTHAFVIHFWSDERCDKDFPNFLEQVRQFCTFVEDYFLAVGDLLSFNIVKDAPPPKLSDDIVYNYLSYNTNL